MSVTPRSPHRSKAPYANDDPPHAKVEENRLTVGQAVDLLLLDSRVRNLSPASVLFYRKSLKELVRLYGDRPAASVTTADLRAFFEPGRTIQTYRSVRRLFKFLVLEEEIAQNPLRRIPKPKEEQKVVEPLTPAEVKRLYEHARQWRPGYIGARDGAIIATLVGSGIRRQELCLLTDKDVRFEQGVLLVNGKGRKQRLVPIAPKLARILMRYLATRNRTRFVLQSDRFFRGRQGEALTPLAVTNMLDRLSKATGVHCWPHRLRHTFASHFMRQPGTDVLRLQAICGWSVLAMATRYAKIDVKTLAEAMASASPANLL